MRWLACMLACVGVLASGLSSCKKQEAPPAASLEPSARPAPTPPPPGATASQRLLGRWHMDLATTPASALNDDLRQLKQSGQALRMEYEFGPVELTVRSFRGGVASEQRYHYEVVKETDHVLQLRRIDEKGEAMQVAAQVFDDELKIGRGKQEVTLVRAR